MTSQLSLFAGSPTTEDPLPRCSPRPRLVTRSGTPVSTRPSREREHELIEEARSLLGAFHEASLALEFRRMVGLHAMLEDIAREMNGGMRDLYSQTGGGTRLMKALSAPDGEEPLHGQAGHFIVEISGTRCAVELQGMPSNYTWAQVEPVDFDGPWLVASASLCVTEIGPLKPAHRVEGEGVSAWITRAISHAVQEARRNERRSARAAVLPSGLVEMRRSVVTFTGNGKVSADQGRITGPVRWWHPSWQPGGWLHRISRTPPAPRESASAA